MCHSGGTRCRQQNVVYKGTCLDCEKEIEEGDRQPDKRGIYIGETGRSLAERSTEHIKKLENCEKDNFILRHWALEHQNKDEPPEIQFRVLKITESA